MTDLFKTLYICEGNVEDAFLRDPTHSEQEYTEALQSPEYRDFLLEIQERFVQHLDATLVYTIHEAKKMLDKVYSGEIDPKHLAAISKHWHATLEKTTPILERLAATVRREEELSTLRLVIQNRDGEIC